MIELVVIKWLKTHWRDILKVIECVVIIITAVIAYRAFKEANIQLKITSKGISEQLTESYNRDISNSINTGIVDDIDLGKPILQEHKGKYTDYQLENFLSIYEGIDEALRSNQIDQSDFCDLFSYYLNETTQNKEIQNYIQKYGYFEGYEDLGAYSKKDCN